MTTTIKIIQSDLFTHYQRHSTTKCRLLKITGRDGSVVGVTSLDRSIRYDDGEGEVLYRAPIGFGEVALETAANLEVGNSEAKVLLVNAGPFTAQSIEAGILDYGSYVIYQVNWEDLTSGRHEIVHTGTIGIIKNVDGVSGVIELRGLPQTLKQNYIELYSLTCRAKFGSGGGGTCVARGQCGFDAESLWQEHTVASVGEEIDRILTLDSPPSVSGPGGDLPFVPGLLQWLTGDNAGLTSEIEGVDGAEITLRFGTNYTIEAGDTCKLRPDCDKTWETCRDLFENQLNFRGEPFIPVSDERSQSVPNVSGVNSASDYVLPDE
jgi:uncharacterized phage protein (TIGR02218 family)